ncbi:hypothetical protein O9K51_08317 [Purpureocillium lavendulum]|uniref:Acetoacetate decarboxylase n=1 Tax=Purpureocillium lavendulum TaxID=1247861 RepID=A0AB34FKW5_9HYPO|nr:hypothetical protein O9K51_08317 [Purpureocillium lavendulum]
MSSNDYRDYPAPGKQGQRFEEPLDDVYDGKKRKAHIEAFFWWAKPNTLAKDFVGLQELALMKACGRALLKDRGGVSPAMLRFLTDREMWELFFRGDPNAPVWPFGEPGDRYHPKSHGYSSDFTQFLYSRGYNPDTREYIGDFDQVIRRRVADRLAGRWSAPPFQNMKGPPQPMVNPQAQQEAKVAAEKQAKEAAEKRAKEEAEKRAEEEAARPASKASKPRPKGPTVQVEFGGQKVDVPKGGYYDRYRMNPVLNEVARDPAVGPDINFFWDIPKKLVDSRVGQIYAPNFYYRTSSVQLLFLAPLDRLRPKLPSPLEPITALPGYGLVAVTFYAYHVCDNDPYNEVSIAIVVRQPGQDSYSTTQLLSSIWNRTFYGYVLALPVNTEIARIRGVYGYQFPKWLANISLDMDEDEHRITAEVAATDGTPDLALDVPLPALNPIPSQSSIVTNNAINKIDGKWYRVAVQTNPLLATQVLFPRNVKLTQREGPLSKLLQELGVSTILRMDVLKEAQMVLNMPTPIGAFNDAKPVAVL